MIKLAPKLVLLVILLIALVGCATIIHGGRQNVPINSTPSGATVKVNQITVTTPGVVNLSRSDPACVLRFEKEGYEPVDVTLYRSMDGWIWGNVLIGGIIGIAIDFSTGAAYQLTPNVVNVTLKELGYEEKMASQGPKDGRVVAVDVLSRPSLYSDYYKLLYQTISNRVVVSENMPSGTVNAGVTLFSDGKLEKVEILENSSQDKSLRDAVIQAVKDSAPFPPFPKDIKEGRKAFTIMIEFKAKS